MPWVSDMRLPCKGEWDAKRRRKPGEYMHLKGRQKKRDPWKTRNWPKKMRGKRGEFISQKKRRGKFQGEGSSQWPKCCRGSGSRGLRGGIGFSQSECKVSHFILSHCSISSCYEMRKESRVLSTSWTDHSLAYSDGVKFVFWKGNG